MKKLSILFLFVILNLTVVNAGLFSSENIKFSLNQKEYYFKVGENAIIPLEIENTYGKQIGGMLSYTYTQEVNQGGMHFSSSNSQSTSFSIKNGKSVQNLNFGTSDNPSTLSISLKFVYSDKETKAVNIEGIKIHFVSQDNQKQNQENRQSFTSQNYQQPQQTQNSQDSFQQMQKEIDEMMGRNQQQNQQTTQQKMQNNQLSQDSSALKNQIQKQLQEQEGMKQEFQRQLSSNQEFQKEHQTLINQGYNLTSGSINPISNNSGDFELNYQKQSGETAQIKGEMENGEVKNLQSLTEEDKNNLIKELKQNKEFQKLEKELKNNGFDEKEYKFSLDGNKTGIKVDYINAENKISTISAEAINGTIQNVKIENLDKTNEKSYTWLLTLIIAAILIFVLYYLYKKYYLKSKVGTILPEKIVVEESFDYKKEAQKLIKKSEELFKKEQYKDAYEKAGQALRLFLSYKYGLKKEITNDNILRFIKDKEKDIRKIKECFDLCSLVEFAKYNPNKKDFDKIIETAKAVIDKS